jgi:hypothetical protein
MKLWGKMKKQSADWIIPSRLADRESSFDLAVGLNNTLNLFSPLSLLMLFC